MQLLYNITVMRTKSRTTNLSFNHPKIAPSLDNIGCAYHWTTDYENAINCFKRALDIYRENYGSVNHINIADSLQHLGMAYRKKKKLFNGTGLLYKCSRNVTENFTRRTF